MKYFPTKERLFKARKKNKNIKLKKFDSVK